MKAVTLASFRANLPRFISTGIAIVLAVGFIVTTLTLSGTFQRSFETEVTQDVQNADFIIEPDWSTGASEDPNADLIAANEAIADLDGVTASAAVAGTNIQISNDGTRTAATALGMLPDELQWRTLNDATNNAWPSAENEATLDAATARQLGLTVGDELTAATENGSVALTIVGITETASSDYGFPTLVVPTEALETFSELASVQSVQVAAAQDAPSTLQADITAAIDNDAVTVRTYKEVVDSRVEGLTGSATALTSVLLAFGLVALFVAGLVITNTFQVIIAQRTRELALLRSIGASTKQIYRSILGEASLLGLVAGAVGVVVALAASFGIAAASSSGSFALGEVTISPIVIAIGLALGVVMTVLAALAPARRATAVQPLEALRPVLAREVEHSRRITRGIIAAVLIIPGAIGLALAGTIGLLPAMLAGVICFVGVLVSAPIVIPAVVKVAGFAVSWIGTPSKLAALNSVRNPARTASTAGALLIGVTLVSMMVIGAASVRESVVSTIDRERPIDLIVQNFNESGINAAAFEAIKTAANPESAVLASSAYVDIEASDGSGASGEALSLPADSLDQVTHAPVLSPEQGTIVVPDSRSYVGLDGQTVTVTGFDGSIELTVVVEPNGSAWTPLMHPNDLAAVSQNVDNQVLMELPANLDAGQVQAIATSIMNLSDEYMVGGGAPERIMYNSILDIMLLVVLALLAVAVAIAIVGIGNTMALSVLERRRESALLRALGLSKSGLRGMLTTEASLIALVSAILGVALGAFFAWAGLMAIGAEATEIEMRLSLPWLQIAVIVVGAGVAGVLASVLPARRATRQSPVEALRE
ncbi:ABC transporter permease [Humidisolicoccus flavus]|uniref:ABC transporter permease n=1 Tax=Humidisolicoccus flavus TaxID=3111414 RepID=UPI003243C7CF